MNVIFNRLVRLTGLSNFEKIQKSKVIIFGIGGVGSWCAESLIRSGIEHLTIVDADTVCPTNINRQLQATTKTVGQVKVDALRDRLLDINPTANIISIDKIYNRETQAEFDLNTFDYVIDAIDSLTPKVDLIEHALKSKATLFSSFGAASKLDPTRIQVKQIWQTHGCPLGRLVRNRLKKLGVKKKFLCVFSDEVLPVYDIVDNSNVENNLFNKKQINGSITHITGIFGFNLAGLVINSIISK